MIDLPSSTGLALAINAGSSSIKFAIFSTGDPLTRMSDGIIERIGTDAARLTIRDVTGQHAEARPVDATTHQEAGAAVIDSLHERLYGRRIDVIGHRIVHGGAGMCDHRLIDAGVIDALRRARSLDPTHLPQTIDLIAAFGTAFDAVPQAACFDTAFHTAMPRVAHMLPIPREYERAGMRRFGFHGLSYAYLMDELRRQGHAGGRVLLAHLGSGASMAAVRDGRPIETTMGFTPASGLMMGSRPGDLDPGVLIHLMREGGLTTEQTDALINKRCGLRGVSQTSADIRNLLAIRATDVRAAEAIDLFCYQARKWIGALAATMDGLDTLVFSGGIGQHAAEIRAEICSGLRFLGIVVDAKANADSLPVVSAETSGVAVRVIPTDEEAMIASIGLSLIANASGGPDER